MPGCGSYILGKESNQGASMGGGISARSRSNGGGVIGHGWCAWGYDKMEMDCGDLLVLVHVRYGRVSLLGEDCWGVLQKGRISRGGWLGWRDDVT